MPILNVKDAALCLGLRRRPILSLQDDIFGVRICGRVLETNSLREQLDFIQNTPGVIHSFTASPTSFTPSRRGTEVTLAFRVEKIEFVRISSSVSGREESFVTISPSCGSWDSSLDVMVYETTTFTLHAFQAGRRDAEEHGEEYTRSVTVTAREEPPEEPTPEETFTGFSSLRIRNCHAEGRPVTIYVLDLTTGSVEDRGTLSAAYDSYGTCVSEEMVLELEDGHRYRIIAYDPGNPYCDPPHYSTFGCRRDDKPVWGDESGPEWQFDIV